MKFAYYINNARLLSDPKLTGLLSELEGAGCEIYRAEVGQPLRDGTDALLSCGGDGTFLSAALIADPAGIPIVGVNFGRIGFLSEYKPENIAGPLLAGEYTVIERQMISACIHGEGEEDTRIALNEISVSRIGSAMVGVDVSVNGEPLPTYWADGLLVATSSGSTAYALSVGGPICTPDSKVLIIAPIAPHNLNLRPLIVPEDASITLSLRSRSDEVMFTADNYNRVLPAGVTISCGAAARKLRCIKPGRSNFFEALRSKLLWGEDVRNTEENQNR